MNYEEITNNIKVIEDLISEEIHNESAELMTDLASRLNAIQSLSSNLVAESIRLNKQDELRCLEELRPMYNKPTIVAKYLSAMTGDTQALHERCRRLHSAVTTKIEYLRSAISLYKTEFALTHRDFGGNL